MHEQSTPDSRQMPPHVAQFVPMLADALALIDDDDHLSIKIAGSDRYMQFAAFGPNLRAETVGNRYLPAREVLGQDEMNWLIAHGWNEPDEGGNYWRHWEPRDPLTAATVTVVTLHRVHGVDDLRSLYLESMDPRVIAVALGMDR